MKELRTQFVQGATESNTLSYFAKL